MSDLARFARFRPFLATFCLIPVFPLVVTDRSKFGLFGDKFGEIWFVLVGVG